jgi:molybdopterin/thiamine biosynthesis adenylyltransferase
MRLPRMKAVFPPVPIGDGLIRIASIDYGIASELTDDEQGNTWRLMELMDGTRTTLDLVSSMRAEGREVTLSDVNSAIDVLYESGFVDDGAVEPPEDLPNAELERYRRNLEFFSYFHQPPSTPYDFQLRLRQAKVTVLGLGGLGSFVALALVALGVGNVHLVDYDHVELMNLNRQILYHDSDIGRLKTEASADRLREVNPHVTITTQTAKVDGVASAREIMAGRDLVVCAADRPRIQLYHWLNEAAFAENVTWLRGAQGGLTINMMMHVPGQTACFECIEVDGRAKFPWYETLKRYWMDVIGDRTLNPCMAPLAGMIGNLTALEAVKHLTGMAEPAVLGRMLIFDLQRMDVEFVRPERMADCPVCGVGVAAGVSAGVGT